MRSRKANSRAISLIVILVFLFSGIAWAEEKAPAPEPNNNLAEQTVPATIMTALKRVNQAEKRPRRQGVKTAQGSVIKVTPGRNVTINVAADQLNRIVTPFTNPVVHKVNAAKVSIDGSVVYLSISQQDGPASMFITENGESDPSISLTLVPAEMTPREIRLEFDGGGSVVSLSSGKAKKWEKDQPYTEAIEKVMLQTARGEVPPGYNLRHFISRDPSPRCRLPVRIEPRQVLEGHNFLVVVSKLTNLSSGQLMMDESACYEKGVRAVAVWPRVSLAPRQSTELYVVYQQRMGRSPHLRPSVLQYPDEPAFSQPPQKAKPRSRPEAITVGEAFGPRSSYMP
jgi:conjugal transfer pilus assembly protein TraK